MMIIPLHTFMKRDFTFEIRGENNARTHAYVGTHTPACNLITRRTNVPTKERTAQPSAPPWEIINQKGRREREKNHVDKFYWWILYQHTPIPNLHGTTIKPITAITPSCSH